MPLFGQHSRELTPQVPTPESASVLLRRYRPLETRATGGFGSVEICLDSRLKRRVAIKRMPLATSPDTPATAIETALAEARTASMLQDPNIVSVIDFTYDSQYAYLVMEYVDGLSLAEFLERVDGHSVTFDEAAAIADSLGQALQFAHENGVLHLDIKPANVLIDRAGHVKLTDFGMATLSAAAGFGGARGGTLGYMPPEQLENQPVDERTDIFALAAVLYEALCGSAPFVAGTPHDSMDRIVRGVTYPSELLPDISELSEEALVSALSPMQRDRPESVVAFCNRFLHQLGDARAGHASLAHMIEKLTGDETDEMSAEEEDEEPSIWDFDPKLGLWGSRVEDARQYAVRAISGAAVALVSFQLLSTMQVKPLLGIIAASLVIGAAAGIAPQIGSALIGCGTLVLLLNATIAADGVLAVAPVAVLLVALISAWWLTWGRTLPAASAALSLILALAGVHAAPSALWLACVPAAYFLSPQTAAITCGLGTLLAAPYISMLGAGGALSTSDAATALANPFTLLSIMVMTGASALMSYLLKSGWSNQGSSKGTIQTALAYAVAFFAGLLLGSLANPMEIAVIKPQAIIYAIVAGLLSSILVWIYRYILGTDMNQSEGDHS